MAAISSSIACQEKLHRIEMYTCQIHHQINVCIVQCVKTWQVFTYVPCTDLMTSCVQ